MLFEEFLELSDDLIFAEYYHLVALHDLCVAIHQYAFACSHDGADIRICR